MEFNICKPGKSGWRKVVAHCGDDDRDIVLLKKQTKKTVAAIINYRSHI